ncbi:MAG TPA: ricin-type beta-trefoil lectin domain protein [Catenuloplanes sp.]|jgi:hypothetical protein
MRSQARLAAVAAVLGAGAVFALASPAAAAPTPSLEPKPVAVATGVTAQALSGRQIKNRWAGACLDNNTVDVYLLGCGGNLPNQRWWADKSRIWSYYSQKCLDGNGAEDVYVLTCGSDNPHQAWELRTVLGTDYFRYVHTRSGKCLDTNGTAVYKTDCDVENTHQHWRVLIS